MESKWYDGLNLKKTCGKYKVSLWQCPQFLFLVMGFIIIMAIIAAYVVASTYEEPELAALSVLILTSFLFVIGHLIIAAFERVALASLSKSEFISIMSHQLRSPLSAIKWQLNILLSDGQANAKLPEGLHEDLDGIYAQNERMIRSVGDLLDVNRIDDNDLVLRPAFFSLPDLSNHIAKEFALFSSANNVCIKVYAPEGLSKVYGDEDRIKRVIEHLLNNAVKYSPKGGEVNVTIKDFGEKVVWKIADRGVGISDDERNRIFDKFFRSANASRYQTDGSGVGLFIAKSIIKMSGGEIDFSTELGQGSTFWFSLPIKKPGK